MKRLKYEKIQWLEFDIFQEVPNLFHGVFLRHGGYSTGPYFSLNLSNNGGDLPSSVEKNVEEIRAIANVSTLATGAQCHGTLIADVFSPLTYEFPACDGLVTDKEDIGLVIKHADCQAAIFVDPKKRVIANIHAGWKGCVQNIYQKTISHLQTKWGCNPAHLLVGISPSLGPEASEFVNYRSEFPEELWPFAWKESYFNLWELAKFQLISSGILPHHIEIASLCTYSHPQDFFSYRRDGITGRHGTLIAFKKT